MTPEHAPMLVIQGGAGRKRSLDGQREIAAALEQISIAIWPQLQAGESALEVVVAATEMLEDNPLFNAGLGSKLQEDGQARMSASLMDGSTERFSGVVNVCGIANPIRLSRHLLDEQDRVLAGQGARAHALDLGLPQRDVRTAKAIENWKNAIEGQTGTVGAVALDRAGNLAAATSTGGRGMEAVGRVSDSCTVAGNFATSAAAVSCTGIGEDIVDGALAVRIVGGVESGLTLPAATEVLNLKMRSRDWTAGLIAVDATGTWSVMHTTEILYWHTIDGQGIHHHFAIDGQ